MSSVIAGADVAFEALLQSVGQAGMNGTTRTPERAARAWHELTAGYFEHPDLTTFPADGYDEIVAVRGIPLYSLCEHHLLPFFGSAHIAYIPGDVILGLSKFARIVDLYGRRLQVQERLTTQIADRLDSVLAPRAVAVVIEAEHLCMAMRGVQKQRAVTTTSVMRGRFRESDAARMEALALLGVR